MASFKKLMSNVPVPKNKINFIIKSPSNESNISEMDELILPPPKLTKNNYLYHLSSIDDIDNYILIKPKLKNYNSVFVFSNLELNNIIPFKN